MADALFWGAIGIAILPFYVYFLVRIGAGAYFDAHIHYMWKFTQYFVEKDDGEE